MKVAYAGIVLLDAVVLMEQFEGLGECPQLADMSDETVKVAAYLYNLLVMSVKNKARKIGRNEGRVDKQWLCILLPTTRRM